MRRRKSRGRHGARVVSVNLRQIAAVRNAGARAAQGEVFFFVDADTRIAPGHVTAALEALEAGGRAEARAWRSIASCRVGREFFFGFFRSSISPPI